MYPKYLGSDKIFDEVEGLKDFLFELAFLQIFIIQE